MRRFCVRIVELSTHHWQRSPVCDDFLYLLHMMCVIHRHYIEPSKNQATDQTVNCFDLLAPEWMDSAQSRHWSKLMAVQAEKLGFNAVVAPEYDWEPTLEEGMLKYLQSADARMAQHGLDILDFAYKNAHGGHLPTSPLQSIRTEKVLEWAYTQLPPEWNPKHGQEQTESE